MRSILRIVFLVPVALVILFFSMANRAHVKIGLDPFAANEAASSSVEAPMFIVVLLAVALGVLMGGAASWLGHLPVRRAEKVARAEAKKTRLEIEKLRQQALAQLPSDGTVKSGKR
jgi:hypothetical protein